MRQFFRMIGSLAGGLAPVCSKVRAGALIRLARLARDSNWQSHPEAGIDSLALLDREPRDHVEIAEKKWIHKTERKLLQGAAHWAVLRPPAPAHNGQESTD